MKGNRIPQLPHQLSTATQSSPRQSNRSSSDEDIILILDDCVEEDLKAQLSRYSG